MKVRFFYDIPYIKEILGYLLIPLLVFIILSSILLMIYSYKNKDHDDEKYNYRMNLFSLLISILLVAVLFAFLLGFAMAFKKQVDAANIKSTISYLVIVSPVIPFFALLVLLFKLIKVIKNKNINNQTYQKVEDENNEFDSSEINITVIDNQGEIVQDKNMVNENGNNNQDTKTEILEENNMEEEKNKEDIEIL